RCQLSSRADRKSSRRWCRSTTAELSRSWEMASWSSSRAPWLRSRALSSCNKRWKPPMRVCRRTGTLFYELGSNGIYIATVTKQNDVPGYFRTMVRLAAQPRSMELWEHYERQVLNQDSEMVMEAGLHQLADLPDLPEEERSIIEAIGAFEVWREEVSDKLTQEANEQAWRDAGLK